MSPYILKTFYSFTPLPEVQLEKFNLELTQTANEYKVLGLMILGKEGLNTTLCAKSEENLSQFIKEALSILGVQETSLIKTSQSQKRPFRRFDVKIRPEIVTLGKEEYVPKNNSFNHLPPDKWQEYLERDDVVVIDTRNTYETEIGKFKNAIDLKMSEFREFPEKIKNLNTDKSKPHLIYCTGGIRCEKAIFEMKKQGFENTFQLEGGILNYLEQKPNQSWEGECFVFDSRVSVDQNLQPSTKYSLCPHCGDVASINLECLKCDHPTQLCPKCLDKATDDKSYQTCSKNCRHHYQLRPDKKGPQQRQFYHD